MDTHHHNIIFIFIAGLVIIWVGSAVGITIDLIHRDSSRSPFFSNTTSPEEKLHATIQRSRANTKSISAPLHSREYEYYAELGIGTPKKPILVQVITANDLSWIQCKPCTTCFKQELPIFDPTKSTTYGPVKCGSTECNMLGPSERDCSDKSGMCKYKEEVRDGSSTLGDLATDILTLGTNQIHKFVFGCGHQNHLAHSEGRIGGMVGLGPGQMSLMSQTKSNPSFGGKFSYCLIPHLVNVDQVSKLKFGDDAVVSGGGALSTPMVSGPVSETYFLALKGVSLGGQSTATTQSSSTDNVNNNQSPTNIIIDIGTTYTTLPKAMYHKLVIDLERHARAKGKLYKDMLCFNKDIKMPEITFHFIGMDLTLPKKNMFLLVEDKNCLLMESPDAPLNIPIFGSLAQRDFIVAYDLGAKKVTFKRTDCKTYR